MPVYIGRIIKLHELGRNLSFLSLADQGQIRDFVYESPKCKLHFGDFIRVEAAVAYNEKKREEELRISEILDMRKAANDGHNAFFNDRFEPRAYEKLGLRASAEEEMHRFFREQGYRLVSSPCIVGEWVSGQTGSFTVDFYGDESRRLTISTMLHHYIMMSLGFSGVYEVATLFRKEYPSSEKRLAEFTNIVVNEMDTDIRHIRVVFEKMLGDIHEKMLGLKLKTLRIPATIKFDAISFNDLLAATGFKELSGHQLGQAQKTYLNDHFESFVWITDFPEATRPFYVKSEQGVCRDCQLWYRGKNFIAAGGDVETDADILAEKIRKEGKNPEQYRLFLDTMRLGMFRLSGMDMGIERFLGVFLGEKSADYVCFPIYRNAPNF